MGSAVIKHTLVLSLLFLLPTHAKDVGQRGSNVTPELGAWFNGVYNHKGIKCCEAADGYPVEYQMRSDNHYWVRFKGMDVIVLCELETIADVGTA